MNCEVSVLMAAYNAQETIAESIATVFAQTLVNLELIVVDDGSSDNTFDLLLSATDPRLTVLRQKNEGPAAARNFAAGKASGVWLACIDADDLWAPNKLQLQRDALLATPGAGVAYAWADVVDANGRLLYSDQHAVYRGDVFELLLQGNFIVSGSNTLINRQIFLDAGGFDASLRAVEDWELHTRLARSVPFVNTPATLVSYRLQQQSLSADLDLMEACWWKASNGLFALANNPKVRQNESAATFYIYLATRALQTRSGFERIRRIARYLKRALELAPASLLRTMSAASPWGALKGLFR